MRELSAQSLDSVSAPEPGPAVAAAPDVAAEPAQTRRPADGAWGLGIALKAALLLPAGRPSDANAIADAAAKAARDFFFSGALALQYALPFHRPLTIGVESGYYRLSGSGGRSFVNDPDFGPELAYQWKMDAVPVLPGLGYELALLPWVRLAPRAGFAAIYVNAQSTYRSGAGVEVSDARQSDWAFGFWLGLEAAFKLGPGSLIGELRYANARTDLGFQKLYGGTTNRDLGDVQGTNVLLGYRLEL